MQHKFLKLAGVKTEKEFYAKFPTEEAFFKAHPEAHPSFAKGGTVPSKDVNTGEFLNTRLGKGNSGQIVPLPDGDPQPKPKRQPIVVTSPNDPRLKAYNDSLNLYNSSLKNQFSEINTPPFNKFKYSNTGFVNYQKTPESTPKGSFEKSDNNQGTIKSKTFPEKIKPIGFNKIITTSPKGELVDGIAYSSVYQKPVQPVVYQKPQLKPYDLSTAPQELLDARKSPDMDYSEKIYKKYNVPFNTYKGRKNYLFTEGEEQPEKIFPAPVAGQSKPARITTPQQSMMPEPQGDYVYGPANSVIGTNVNGKFTPINMPEQRGKVNQADWDMLNNQESMKKYVQQKGLEYKCGGKLKGKKKAAWGASLGTDPFVGGLDPVKPLNLNGNAFIGADGKPVSTSPSAWDTPQPLPTAPIVPGFNTSPSPSWQNYAPLSGQQQAPVNPNAPKMYANPDYIPNQGEGQLNRGQLPNLTPGQQANDKNAVKPKAPMSMPKDGGGGGMTGAGILAGLNLFSAFMPDDKKKRRYVRPEDMQSYNPNAYGTGSQALSEYGNTLKGNKKKAFWGALIGPMIEKGKEIKKGIHGNINEAMAPIMNIANNRADERNRLDNLDVQNMANLQQPQQMLPGQQMMPLQQPYNPNAVQYMENGGEMYGQGGELMTGKGGQTELKSYNPYDGGTFQFNGASHEDGGIDISYKGQPAEVEGQETAFKDEQGDLKIMGNLKNPLTGSKYKDDLKRIADKEKKAQKLIDKGTVLINSANPEDAYEALAFNSGKAMAIGGMISQKRLAESKQHLGNMQEAHLEIARENGQSPEKVFRDGGTMYANGGTAGDPIYEEMLRKAAEKYGVKYDTIKRMIEQESSFTPGKTSNAGAMGIMQFMPNTAKQFGLTKEQLLSKDSKDVEKQIDAGVRYYKTLLSQNNNDEILAAAAYNAGQGTVNDFRRSAKKSKTEYTGQDLLQRMEWKRANQPSDKTSLAQNQTYDYIKNLYAPVVPAEEFRKKYYEPGAPTDGMFNGTYKVPPMNFTPKPMDIQTVQGSDTPMDLKQPAPYDKPSNARGINPMQFLGEGYALATNREEPVKAQLYNPELYSPYQVSFQDRLNENQATFNSVEKQLAYDPTSLATLAGQKYSANSSVLADEFRTNQGISNDIINKNVSLLNDAKFKNLGILDQQYTRQSQAKSNTKKINQDALSSISSKLLQKEASNNQLRVYENLYQDYSFDPHTGKAIYHGAKAGEHNDWSGIQPLTAGQPTKTVVKTSPTGERTTTDTYSAYDPNDPNSKTYEFLGLPPKQFTRKKKSLTELLRQ